MSNKRQLYPVEDYQSQARDRLLINRKEMVASQFRDALTRAVGAIRGLPTETTQWNRWTP
jgi:hypothetical protein